MSKKNQWVLLSELPPEIAKAIRLYQHVTGDSSPVVRWYRSDAVGIMTRQTIDIVRLARIPVTTGIRIEVHGVAPQYTEVSMFMSAWQQEHNRAADIVGLDIVLIESEHDAVLVRKDAPPSLGYSGSAD